MITTNTQGTALSTAFTNAVNSPSREWRGKLINLSTGEEISGELMGITIHKGTRGGQFTFGTIFAPYFEASVSGLSDDLKGAELQFQLAPVVQYGYEPTEFAAICTGTVYDQEESGDLTTLRAAGALALSADTLLETTSSTVSDILAEVQTTTGKTVTLGGAAATLGTSVTIGGSLRGFSIREALTQLAGFYAGFVSETAGGDILLSSFAGLSSEEIPLETLTTYPAQGASLALTGWTCVVVPGGVSAQGGDDPGTSYTDGTSALTYTCPIMTEAQFQALSPYITDALTLWNGSLEQALGNPLLEPWDALSLEDDTTGWTLVGADETITFNGGVSCSFTSQVISEEERPTVQVGPLETSVQEIKDDVYTLKDQSNYFWIDEDGAHVTKVKKEIYKQNPVGGSTLTDSDGFHILDGAEPAASVTRVYEDYSTDGQFEGYAGGVEFGGINAAVRGITLGQSGESGNRLWLHADDESTAESNVLIGPETIAFNPGAGGLEEEYATLLLEEKKSTFGGDLHLEKFGSTSPKLVLAAPDLSASVTLRPEYEERLRVSGDVLAPNLQSTVKTASGTISVASGNGAPAIRNQTEFEILTPGNYILSAGLIFPANGNGMRSGAIGISSTAYGAAEDSRNAVTGGYATRMNFCVPVHITAATSFYLYAQQNSGETLTVSYYWRVMRTG